MKENDIFDNCFLIPKSPSAYNVEELNRSHWIQNSLESNVSVFLKVWLLIFKRIFKTKIFCLFFTTLFFMSSKVQENKIVNLKSYSFFI